MPLEDQHDVTTKSWATLDPDGKFKFGFPEEYDNALIEKLAEYSLPLYNERS